MGTRYNKTLWFKVVLTLLVLLLSGLLFSGCREVGTIARGWSGGALADDTLFVGSMEGKLVALDTAEGSLLWSAPLESPESGAGGFGCAPASTAVAIYGSPAVSENEGLVYVGGYNGIIYAFSSEEARNEPRWVYPRQGTLASRIVGSPVVAESGVFLGSSAGKVYALDAAEGFKEWEFEAGDKIWASPAVDSDSVYIGSFDKKLYALSAADGSKKWEFETGGAIVSTPLVYDNAVYFGSFDRHLYAVDSTSGRQLWRFPATDGDMNQPGNWFWAKPVIHDGTIYAGCLDGKVYALKAGSGDRLVEFDLGSPISSSPVVAGDTIIAATEDGIVHAIGTKDNRQRQLVNLEEKIYAPLAASGGYVYIHTDKDNLYEVDAKTGRVRELRINFGE